ncbi:MAG: 4-sulfomuconolactone hydrolase [Paracidovorax wautersii]|uniref:4-sulfomuconolactone hydrolase n=1 Tax=Paracidovorax wautersii TaxID=1177982 RepID=A0A7V8JNR2_9BURK|nr:MAG: 4-sulfomuconolactone hydrolase [Paracidovorax wautersii]
MLFSPPKIDCHCHIFDPDAFPYQADTPYRPAGAEIATARYFTALHQAYGVGHALLVGPNSGYGTDNRCMLDAIAQGQGRYKGIAVLPNPTSTAELRQLQTQGIVGVAFNFALQGLGAYADADPLFKRLADLDMFVQVQVQNDQMAALAPRLVASGARVLVDHHGRPDVNAGLNAPGFQALLRLADSGRCFVKLSGHDKFTQRPYPFEDAAPYTQALLNAFGPAHCLWGSDWPLILPLIYGHLSKRHWPARTALG